MGRPGPGLLRSDWDDTWGLLRTVEGHLTHDEARWLYLTAATCPAPGAIVEIGSFKGKSTIALAKGARASQRPARVIAVDPHSFPSPTDPGLPHATSSEPDFRANLARAGVTDVVDVRVGYSVAVARDWRGPIRLLWLDGDHTLEGVSADLDSWLGYLPDGSVLAMHDVLHRFEGPARAFMERVLRSPGWINIGFVKSIGYATRATSADVTRTMRTKALAALLRRAIPLSRLPSKLARLQYKLCRAAILRL